MIGTWQKFKNLPKTVIFNQKPDKSVGSVTGEGEPGLNLPRKEVISKFRPGQARRLLLGLILLRTTWQNCCGLPCYTCRIDFVPIVKIKFHEILELRNVIMSFHTYLAISFIALEMLKVPQTAYTCSCLGNIFQWNSEGSEIKSNIKYGHGLITFIRHYIAVTYCK